MGFARVFWIREAMIRQFVSVDDDAVVESIRARKSESPNSPERYFEASGEVEKEIGKRILHLPHGGVAVLQRDNLAEEIGRQVLSLSAKQSQYGANHLGEAGSPLPLFESPSVFFPFWSYHSSMDEGNILIWVGDRLCEIQNPTSETLNTLQRFTKTIGSSNVVGTKRHASVVDGRWQNQLAESMYASVYYIREDFSRDFERIPQADWPCRDIGDAILGLMFSNWSSYGGPGNLERCCSFRQSEFAVIIWAGNCLRLISEIEAEEFQRLRDYLASK